MMMSNIYDRIKEISIAVIELVSGRFSSKL